MDNILLERIDKLLIESPLYGKEKSRAWKMYREMILNAKNKRNTIRIGTKKYFLSDSYLKNKQVKYKFIALEITEIIFNILKWRFEFQFGFLIYSTLLNENGS